MRARLTLASLAVAVLGIAFAGPAAGAKTTKCSLGSQGRKLGPTYVTSLTVSGGATCSTGIKVVKAYYKCRVKAGGVKGRCASKVDGFSCTEKRTSIPIQFDATVTCSKGKERVVHQYEQNT